MGALSVACVRERTLFEKASAGASEMGAGGDPIGAGAQPGAGGGGKAAGDPGAPWDERSCVTALSQGKTGEPCVETLKCSASSGCCQIQAWCEGGQLQLANNCDACAASCTGDADCGPSRVCEAYQCRDCPKEACPLDWISVIRNGCSVCVPPSQCKATGDPRCAQGQACLAGLSCLPGCKGDPACCFGNQCAPASCASLEGLDCAVVGCPAGETCKVVGEPAACACDAKSGKWACDAQPINSCSVPQKL